jgi:hypothetical protein
LLDVYQRSIAPIRYEEAQYIATAVRTGMGDNKYYKKMMAHFDRESTPYKPPVLAIVPATDEAAQWFIDNGIPIA